MAEIKITFDLTFSRRRVAAIGAVVTALCAVPELGSESVTLSTYYPAPSGVYTSLIGTSGSRLGRDGGTVAIGTNAAGGTRLSVMNGNVGIGTLTPNNKLEIAGGNAKAEGTGSGFVVDSGAASRRVGLMTYGGADGVLVAGSGTYLRLGHRTNGADVSAAGPVFRPDVSIEPVNGSVGIGTTNPSERLEANGIVIGRTMSIVMSLP